MVLDRERLRNIIADLDSPWRKSLRTAITNLQEEIEFLESQQSHDVMISAVALRSRPVQESGTGQSATDLCAMQLTIDRFTDRQKKVLRKSLRDCMSKQLVYYHVYDKYIRLSEKERSLVRLTAHNSYSQVALLLEKKGIQMSRTSVRVEATRIMDRILELVNPMIETIADYGKEEERHDRKKRKKR